MAKYWGTPTWIFFHTLAEHIDPVFYQHNRDVIKTFIVNICNNLPCGECTTHASSYIKYNLTANNISTKENLKQFFFKFHNEVNRRTNKPLFTNYDTYKTYTLNTAFVNFRNAMTRNNTLNRGFSDSMHRRNVVNSIEVFLIRHKDKFTWL